jgi:1,4-alpha-glucan branching enzyme
VLVNATPVPRDGYRVGVPAAGHYQELLNTDSAIYGGSNKGNGAGATAQPTPWQGQPYSIVVTLPPLGTVVLAKA